MILPCPSCSVDVPSSGLRLYAAAPSLLERVVPLSTSKNFSGVDGFDLMGYALPPGTIVSTQAWSMHRDAGVFPSPETFLPERWLPSYSSSANDDAEVDTELREREKERLARMAQHMMPFGTGSRVCGGQVLAGVMMKIVLVALLRNFEFEAAEGTDEGSMGIRDSFVCLSFLPFLSRVVLIGFSLRRSSSPPRWSANSSSTLASMHNGPRPSRVIICYQSLGFFSAFSVHSSPHTTHGITTHNASPVLVISDRPTTFDAFPSLRLHCTSAIRLSSRFLRFAQLTVCLYHSHLAWIRLVHGRGLCFFSPSLPHPIRSLVHCQTYLPWIPTLSGSARNFDLFFLAVLIVHSLRFFFL